MSLHDVLAALADGGRYRTHPGDRPVRRRLDSDGSGLTVELPGPRVLASVFVLPFLGQRTEVFQHDGALVTRPHGSAVPPVPLDVLQVAAELRAYLAALPERAEAGRPYCDLRLLVTVCASATIEGYLLDAVRFARLLAPVWRPAKERKPRPPAMTPAEKKAAQKDRDRQREDETAEWWLRLFLGGQDAPTPGDRLVAGDLYALAAEVLTDIVEEAEEDLDAWAEEAADDGSPRRPRVPGRTRFYAVADQMLGPRRRINGARVYVVPAEHPDAARPTPTAATTPEEDLVRPPASAATPAVVEVRFLDEEGIGRVIHCPAT